MKPAEPATDQPADNGASKRGRRRSWWLSLFLILSVVVVLVVVVITKPSASHFDFLRGTKVLQESEDIVPNYNLSQLWMRLGYYASAQPYEETVKGVGAELVSLGWREEKLDDVTTKFTNPSGDTEISVGKSLSGASILIHQSHPPTSADRVRIWLNDRLPFLSRNRQINSSFAK